MDKIFSIIGKNLVDCILQNGLAADVHPKTQRITHLDELAKYEEDLRLNDLTFGFFSNTDRITVLYRNYTIGSVYIEAPLTTHMDTLTIKINNTYFGGQNPKKWKRFIFITGGYFLLKLMLYKKTKKEFMYKNEMTNIRDLITGFRQTDLIQELNSYFTELSSIHEEVQAKREQEAAAQYDY